MTITAPRFDDLRPTTGCNRLLGALAPDDYALLEPYLRLVPVRRDQILFEPGDDVVSSCFPCEGTVTAIMVMNQDERFIEAATIGREGAIGGIVSHGHRPAFGRGMVQVGGHVLKISADRLEDAKRRSPRIADLFARYADYLLAQVMQFSSCNAFHSVEQRLARVLVMAQDRVGIDVLDFTQQTLADSLGVQRTSVTAVARALEERGAIQNRRGRIQVTNRAELERAACGCYIAIEDHFARLLPKVVL